MKNITLRIEEETLGKARRIAAEQSSSVNAMIREFLKDLVRNDERRSRARRELVEICSRTEARRGTGHISRDTLYER